MSSGSTGYSKEYIEALITDKAALAGIDPKILLAIAKAESGFQQKWNYMNPTGDPNSIYSAYGVFQIIKTNEIKYGISRMTLEGNISLAIQIYLFEGTTPWNISKHNWSR